MRSFPFCNITLIAVLIICSTCCTDSQGKERVDLLIRGGKVVDGTGAPWYIADIAVRDGTISRIGSIDANEVDAGKILDATGLVVAPGFIDMMGQTANPFWKNPQQAMNLLAQGITTINAGEGGSAAPLGAEAAKNASWRTMAEYFQMLDMKGLPLNVVQTVGHTQVREIVMGEDDRRPTDDELEKMQDLVREAMEAGAIGVSTALIYPPAVYARTEEITALASVAADFGGRYYTHMRNEGDLLLEAIDEALLIGRDSGAPVHIFHLKAAGKQNWGQFNEAIAKIERARRSGQQVTADIYPYINNGLGLAAFIHPRHFANGHAQLIRRLDDPGLRDEIRKEMETSDGWENWYRHTGRDWNKVIIAHTSNRKYSELLGQSVGAISAHLEKDPWDVFFDLVKADAFACPETMSEANVIRALQQDFISYCTDAGPFDDSRITSHPRAFGAFGRIFSRYVRELGVITLQQAVSRASAAAANDIMALDRGRIAPGLAADVIVFDDAEFADRATFAKPHELSTGMKYVVVNGTLVLDEGKYTGKRPGRVLRGPGYRESRTPHAVATGKEIAGMKPVDRVIQRFMQEHRVVGAALAISDRGRLVHARGFGYADLGERQPVEPTSLFRIASISKPVTAMAIMQLVEQGKLKLDDKVFDILDYEAHIPEGAEADPRLSEITIRHLLQHRAGFDRDKSFDPMFQSRRFAKELGESPPAKPDHIIRIMLGRQLDFDPGERYAYSNLGYCLLGRVIEKLTSTPYDEYVKKNVLAPIGITAMSIGASQRDGRQPDEVCYYDPGRGESVFEQDGEVEVASPYGGFYLEAMDAHGAWIASAVDLVRFGCAIEKGEECPILKASSINDMFDRPPGKAGHDDDGSPKPTYYGLSWSVTVDDAGKKSFSHSGSLPGTSTRLTCRPDGRNFAILFSSRQSPTSSRLSEDVLGELNKAIAEIEAWPEEDQFGDFE